MKRVERSGRSGSKLGQSRVTRKKMGAKGGEVKGLGFLGPLPMLILVLDAV